MNILYTIFIALCIRETIHFSNEILMRPLLVELISTKTHFVWLLGRQCLFSMSQTIPHIPTWNSIVEFLGFLDVRVFQFSLVTMCASKFHQKKKKNRMMWWYNIRLAYDDVLRENEMKNLLQWPNRHNIACWQPQSYPSHLRIIAIIHPITPIFSLSVLPTLFIPLFSISFILLNL